MLGKNLSIDSELLLSAVICDTWHIGLTACVISDAHISSHDVCLRFPVTHPTSGVPAQCVAPAGVAAPHGGQSTHAVMPATVSDAPYVPLAHVADVPVHAVASEV